MRKCKDCKEPFTPVMRNGIPLTTVCQKCLTERKKAKLKKCNKGFYVIGVKVGDGMKYKRGDMTRRPVNWLLKEAQKHFNEFIRERDKIGEDHFYCGTCKKTKKIEGDNYHACHCFPAGNFPALRFHEDNVHGGCKACNYFKHGATYNFQEWVKGKIGEERYNKLMELKQSGKKWKWDKNELIGIINKYKSLNKNKL